MVQCPVYIVAGNFIQKNQIRLQSVTKVEFSYNSRSSVRLIKIIFISLLLVSDNFLLCIISIITFFSFSTDFESYLQEVDEETSNPAGVRYCYFSNLGNFSN